MKKHYLAVDLGASSGRVIVGTLEDGKLTLEEMNRFWNGPTEIRGTLYWDFVHLFREIKQGIAIAKKKYGETISSIGIDTWGVDFGLFDENGELLGNPINYRDERTAGMMEKVFERVPREEVFNQTGIQFMDLNTLYQMMSLSIEKPIEYREASKLLFAPDLLAYWLTGNMVAERTMASTSQFYNPVTKDWAYDLLEKLGIRTDLFADLVDPGTVTGEHDGVPVVSVGGHDTASAFAAVPVAEGESAAFLSSGTWSLLGTELDEPVINAEALAANFTNEVGVADTIRLLKNLSGFWVLQELKRAWALDGHDYSWKDMDVLCAQAEPLKYFFNPADPLFATPGDMAKRIGDYCEATGQERPTDHGAIILAAYENLALLYGDTFEALEKLAGKSLDVLRIVGGGSNSKDLNQFAANATGRKVLTGPTEATAIGNLVTQMVAMGDVESIAAGREIIRASFADESAVFEPENADQWKDALAKWRAVRDAYQG